MNDPGRADREKFRQRNIRNARLLMLAVALSLAVGFGIMTPSPSPDGMSRFILFGFVLSTAFAFVTVVAMIPSPPDPRRLLLRRARLNRMEDAPETSYGNSMVDRAMREIEEPRGVEEGERRSRS